MRSILKSIVRLIVQGGEEPDGAAYWTDAHRLSLIPVEFLNR